MGRHLEQRIKIGPAIFEFKPGQERVVKAPEQDGDAGDDDPLVCVWPDGWKHDVPEMTYAK